MPDWDAILIELRLIRASMDKIAALVAGQQAKAELMPVYVCGHRHISRAEAMACKESRAILHRDENGNGVRRDGSLVPPNADAGAFG